MAAEHYEKSRNPFTVAPWVKAKASALSLFQGIPEHFLSGLPLWQETLDQHVGVDRTKGGNPRKNLRCLKQKGKRHESRLDYRKRIPNRRPLLERPEHVQGSKQVIHWGYVTVICAHDMHFAVTVVQRESAQAVIVNVSNKTAEQVTLGIFKALTPSLVKVKTLTFDNGR